MHHLPLDRNARPLTVLAILTLCLINWAPAELDAAEITVAAAADLTFAFKDVAARFEKQTGDTVRLSYGSSGNFFPRFKMALPMICFFQPTSTTRKNSKWPD